MPVKPRVTNYTEGVEQSRSVNNATSLTGVETEDSANFESSFVSGWVGGVGGNNDG